jgi:hypothetical protein
VNSEENVACLSLRRFLEKKRLALSRKAVLGAFDGKWTLACMAARVTPCEARDVKYLKPVKKHSKELIRGILEWMFSENPEGITGANLARHGLSMGPIYRIWGSRGLEKACEEFGLKISRSSIVNKELSLERLADDWLQVALSLTPPRIPTLMELANRAAHDSKSYADKFGGYPRFKELAITYLLESSKVSDPTVAELFRSELVKLKGRGKPVKKSEIRPHGHGRILGFRQFEYVPTYEQEVVAIFVEVAGELGFRIKSIREEFPDCMAQKKDPKSRRDRWHDCLIEFEWTSSNYVTDGHPIDGCDLIVCWKHDWANCPVQVLELESKINELPGARPASRKKRN